LRAAVFLAGAFFALLVFVPVLDVVLRVRFVVATPEP
jgi:hypothetical protein